MADEYKDRRYSVYFYSPRTLESIRKLAEKEYSSISKVITDACNCYLVLRKKDREGIKKNMSF